MLIGALSAIEMSLAGHGPQPDERGVAAAMETFADENSSAAAGPQ